MEEDPWVNIISPGWSVEDLLIELDDEFDPEDDGYDWESDW